MPGSSYSPTRETLPGFLGHHRNERFLWLIEKAPYKARIAVGQRGVVGAAHSLPFGMSTSSRGRAHLPVEKTLEAGWPLGPGGQRGQLWALVPQLRTSQPPPRPPLPGLPSCLPSPDTPGPSFFLVPFTTVPVSKDPVRDPPAEQLEERLAYGV